MSSEDGGRGEGVRRFSAAMVEGEDPEAAVRQAIEQVRAELGDGVTSFAMLFLSAHHVFAESATLRRLPGLVADGLRTEAVIGTVGSGLVGGDRELEGRAAVVVAAARLPECRATLFHCNEAQRRAWSQDPGALSALGLSDSPRAPILLLADPFSFDIDELLTLLSRSAPRSPVIGGLASGPPAPGLSLLVAGRELEAQGCVGLQLEGDFDFEAVVSQGCKPIGRHVVVTGGRGNLITSLRGKPPRQVLSELASSLSESDLALLRRSLLIGRVVNERQDSFRRGDFLVRPVLRLSDDGLVIGDAVKVGQTVQFHVRDADTAREDLATLLAQRDSPARVFGALLFTCNGRGEALFGRPNHDTELIREALDSPPVAGFFCGGEIGPIGDRAWLHGFTSSLGLFTAPRPDAGA